MNFWIKLKILNGILSNQRIIKSVEDLIFNLVYLDGDDYIKYGGRFIVRKRFFSIIVCVVMLFTMNVTAFAAETQENYSETEKTMTFEITPTALTSGSSRHSVGMLNSFLEQMIQWQLPLLVLLQSAAHLFRQAPQSVK